MAVEHDSISNSELHEPKGVSTASSEQVYVADGASSGSWDYQYFTLNVEIPDISTAQSVWVVSPWAATIERIDTVIYGTLATADATITAEIGGTAVTGSSITVAYSGSAAGDADNASPSAANAVTLGQPVEIITDGASTNAVACNVTLKMKRTG